MTMFKIYALDEHTKSLPIVDTASGSIATFDTDLTENLVEVKCQIVAKQASGTPSPSNPLPIGVYDSLTLYHNDINMWDEQWEIGAYSVATGAKSLDTQRIRCKNKIPVKSNTEYFFKFPYQVTTYGFYLFQYDINGNYLEGGQKTATKITTTANTYYITFCTQPIYGTTYGNDISINYPSTDTQYHAYNGTTANIPFGQTVANGVLDIGSGKLRVTHGVVDMGSLQWTNVSGYAHHFNAVSGVDFKPNLTTGACSCFQIVYTSYAEMGNYTLRIESGTLTVRDDDYASPSDLQTALSGQKLVSELNTPIEIQLDSITLQALLNENNIWCDTGDTEVKFLLSVGKKIA